MNTYSPRFPPALKPMESPAHPLRKSSEVEQLINLFNLLKQQAADGPDWLECYPSEIEELLNAPPLSNKLFIN